MNNLPNYYHYIRPAGINLKRTEVYEDKKNVIESLPASYPHPLIEKEDYDMWRNKIGGRVVPPKIKDLILNLLP